MEHMPSRLNAQRNRLEVAGQGHVLRWWDELRPDQRESLLAHVEGLDLDWVAQAACLLLGGDPASPFPEGVEPVEDAPLREASGGGRAVGEALLAEGKVAAVVVAGGQGTRLGSDAPKGCYPVGPVSGCSLYQLHAQGVLAAARRWGRPVPFCVMTSEATDEPTRAFFEENKRFGLPPEDVLFFRQAMVPALSPEGKLVLAEKDRVLMSPDGHGGLFAALAAGGVLDELEGRGVEEISYFQVDNPLVRQVDPVFLGAHRQARAGFSCKALRKRDPEEGLGVFGLLGGRPRVVEYSDLPQEAKERRRADGSLAFGLGSPAIHAFSVAFVRGVLVRLDDLPLHIAAKASPCVDASGSVAPPQGRNVRKFEKFVFDALPLAERWALMEVRREDEFAPVKNREGQDSPATARRAMLERWSRWLEAAGCALPRDAEGRAAAEVEISPLFAMDEEQLRERMPLGRRVEWKTLLA